MKTKFLSVLLFLSLIMGSCINEPFHTRARFPSVSIDGKLIAFFMIMEIIEVKRPLYLESILCHLMVRVKN